MMDVFFFSMPRDILTIHAMLRKIKNFLFRNDSTKQTVAKNTIWLSISQFGGRLIKAVIVIYAARVLGTAQYGVFSYAVTLAGFMGLFMEPGINSIVMRDSAKANDENRREMFSTTLAIKLCLIAIGAAIIIFIAPSFSTLPGAKILIPIAACIMMFDTMREFFLSLMRGMEKMQWDAGIFLTTNLAIVILGFWFMMLQPTAWALSWGYALGTAVGTLFAIFVVRDYIKDLFSRFSARLVKPILQSAWPFAIVGALGLLFTNTDILIISWMRTASEVGIYSAAIRIIQVLYLVPGVVQMSTLPLFSRLARHDDAKFRIGLEKTLCLIFLLSIPVAIGGIILATPIMSLIFGPAFASGGPAFQFLLASLIADYPGSIVVNAIFAYSHQKSLIISSAIGGVANVALDLLLIPRWGMVGSAFGTLIAQILTNGYLWYRMNQINRFSVIPKLGKIALSGIVMGITTFFLSHLGVEVILNILVSAGCYVFLLWILREPTLLETKNIIGLART
jgi:O-antigen/teichoic acid export membrane protein